MRQLVFALALALVACDQPAPAEKVAVPPAPAQELRTDAASVDVYESKKFQALNGGSVSATDAGLEVVTDPRQGAWSASLSLGDKAMAAGVKLRVNFAVTDGRLTMLMTHANWEKDFKPYQQSFVPGTTTVDLPIDRSGKLPLLILSNGRKDGVPTKAVIKSVELVPG